MYFSVIPRDGKVEPGTYTATCQDDELKSQKSTTFVVLEEPTPTTTAMSTAQPLIREGIISYDESNEQMTPHLDQWGFFPSQFHKWCNPTLTISSDGTISGSCYNPEDAGDLGLYGTWSGGAYIEGKINGNIEADGRITFQEELTEQHKPGDISWWEKRVTIIKGTGTFVSATQATGTATFTAECTAATEVASHCGLESKYDYFTGTIPWEFIVSSIK
ncbi:MAG: hypothetical protein C0410_16015 [Anaerolinea sp.]|nr:hypothetical protein [Anaerolinea sp.]